MIKIEITRKGVHDAKGNPIAIGTEMTIKADTLPASLVNKCRVIAEKPAKAAAVTNPAKGAKGGQDDADKAKAEADAKAAADAAAQAQG